MSEERPPDGGEPGDALPPHYRPWGAGEPGRGRGRIPPPPVPPEHPAAAPPAGYAPQEVAHRPIRPSPSPVLRGRPGAGRVGTGIVRPLLGSVLALVALGSTWLPWFKTVSAGMFTLSDSASARVVDAWDVPARFLWSYHSPRGGPSLGWLVLGVAVGILVLGFVANATTAARLLAAVEALIGIVFLVQVARIVDDSPSFGPLHVGVTDVVGIGAYVLLLVSIALLVVPRD